MLPKRRSEVNSADGGRLEMSLPPGRVSLQPAVAQKADWRLQKKESEGERGGSMDEDMGGMTRQQRNKCRRLGSKGRRRE